MKSQEVGFLADSAPKESALRPPLPKWDPFYEPPFDGITKTSVKLAIAILREVSSRFAEVENWEPASRLDVVARALEETLEDDTIDWVPD
jgi:hypothetical protein